MDNKNTTQNKKKEEKDYALSTKIEIEDLINVLPAWFKAINIGDCFVLNDITYKKISKFSFCANSDEDDKKRIEMEKNKYNNEYIKFYNIRKIYQEEYNNGLIDAQNYNRMQNNIENAINKLDDMYRNKLTQNCVYYINAKKLLQKKFGISCADEEE